MGAEESNICLEHANATANKGIIAAILFGVVAFSIFSGHQVNDLARPLPFFAYPFYAATLVGWAWTLLSRKHLLAYTENK